jgi:uncharacterized membrane protein YfcA
MLAEIILSSIILAAATAIQSVVGFGLALFSVPLLVLVGLPLLPSVFLVLSVSWLSSILGVKRLKGDLQPRLTLQASLYRMVGVIPGYAAALYTVNSSPANLKAAMGFVIGLGVLAQSRKLFGSKSTVAAGTEPNRKLAPYAFASSGFLTGWLGMGGPPLVFWLLTGKQDPKKTRAFLYSIYVLTIPFQLAVMAYHSPETVTMALPIMVLALPASLVVTSYFLKLGDRLDVENLQKLSLGLLTVLSGKAFLDWYSLVA